jgi:glycosyltransferase involved in cell wall biosynthesis
MTNLYSSVVSYHTNPYTCGVARFNQALAKEMRVPVCSVSKFVPSSKSISLLSIKFEEMSTKSAEDMWTQLDQVDAKFDLFLHGVTQSEIENRYLNKARRVIVATREYAEIVRAQRPDVLSYFAPGAVDSSKKINADITLLTFGMAHKIRSDGYRKLGEILTADERSVQLEISTALHDGTSFSEDFFSVGSEISEVFNGNVSFLGFLADDEVSRRLRAADALVAFFPSGVRENNTTVLSAMAHGCAVITNLDSLSPSWMKHNDSVFDISQLNTFPTNAELARVGIAARVAVNPYSFESLATLLTNTTEQ